MADRRLIVDPPGEPEANMAADEKIARDVLEQNAPLTLRIYRWSRPAVSLGRRQNPDDLPAGILHEGIPLVRRPTGGGAVVHSLDELTYAVAVPRRQINPALPLHKLPGLLHENLREILVERGLASFEELAIQRGDSAGPFQLCFSAPVCGDLLRRGKKAAGSALRVWRGGVLIQGSIQGLPVSAGLLTEALVAALARSFQDREANWCRGGDLNPDELTPTTP